MKISTLLFSLALLSLSSYGQNKADSTRFYNNELLRLKKAYEDSFRNNPKTQVYSEKLRYAQSRSDNYVGIWIFTQIASADYDVLNADNEVDGFGPISGPMGSVGLGFGIKKNRWIFEFGAAAGLNKKTIKENETIKTAVSPIQFDLGYDLVKKRSISLFPYVGLGIRSLSLEYKAPAQFNSSPNSIASLIQTNTSVKDRESELGYQAGIGFEYLIPASNGLGTPVFVKFGTNRAFKRKAFNLEGHPYNANLQYGNWTVTVGIKLIAR